MAIVTTTAFVLRADPLSERDLVVALLTRDHGVVRAAVKGARGRSRRGAALQTLNEVAATYFRREGADLARLDAVDVVRGSFELAERPETAMLLPYLAESALTFVPESEPGDEVYRLVRHVLDALLAGAPAELAARYFEVWLLRLAGLLPEDGTCASCGEALGAGPVRFDPEVPGFLHAACAGRTGSAVGEPAVALLRSMRRSRLTALAGDARAGPADLAALEGLAREIRRRFLGHELKSYRFLGTLG